MSLKEIASRVGTSVTTVSLVLNHKDVRVSNEKRTEILNVAREIGYAKRTIEKTLRSIGVIVPNICNAYYAELVKEIIRCAQKNGYNTILCDSDTSEEGDLTNLENLRQSGVDGIIITMSLSSESGLEKMRRLLRKRFWPAKIPIVMLDRINASFNTYSICVNHYQGAYLAVEYLLSLGHRRIACLSGPMSLGVTNDRLEGYRDAMREAGVLDEALIVEAGFDQNAGYEAFDRLEGKDFTAVFAMNDEAAVGACFRAQEKGIRIPEDISIMGYDDTSSARFNSVALSTVRQPIQEMVQFAISMILDAIHTQENPAIRNNIVLQPELVIRRSTAECRKDKRSYEGL